MEPLCKKKDDHNQNVVVSSIVNVKEHLEVGTDEDMKIDDESEITVEGTDDEEEEYGSTDDSEWYIYFYVFTLILIL